MATGAYIAADPAPVRHAGPRKISRSRLPSLRSSAEWEASACVNSPARWDLPECQPCPAIHRPPVGVFWGPLVGVVLAARPSFSSTVCDPIAHWSRPAPPSRLLRYRWRSHLKPRGLPLQGKEQWRHATFQCVHMASPTSEEREERGAQVLVPHCAICESIIDIGRIRKQTPHPALESLLAAVGARTSLPGTNAHKERCRRERWSAS
jgi:hypothetical protein